MESSAFRSPSDRHGLCRRLANGLFFPSVGLLVLVLLAANVQSQPNPPLTLSLSRSAAPPALSRGRPASCSVLPTAPFLPHLPLQRHRSSPTKMRLPLLRSFAEVGGPSSNAPAATSSASAAADDDELPSDLREATDQAAAALLDGQKKGETFMRVGMLIEEMVRGAKQNQDLQEPRVLCRVASTFASKADLKNVKFLFANVGSSMQQKKWLTETDSNAQVSSMDRPQVLDGSEDLLVLVKPDIFALKNVMALIQQIESMPYEERPVVVMLNEDFGDQEDKGEGFLNVPQLETTQARRLKGKFMVTYFLEQILSRQTGIIVLFKRYPRAWKLFVADEGSYKLVKESIKEPSQEELYEYISEFKRISQLNKLWRSFRWRKQVEGFLDDAGLPKPFQEYDANK